MHSSGDLWRTMTATPWLRWAGGKRAIAPLLVEEIIAVKPKLYIEPFLGGGAVALALPPELPKTLADINPYLIDCWLCMKNIPTTLISQVRLAERHYGNDQDGYLAARDAFNAMTPAPRRMWAKRSALFIYLNARSFNGLWRVNADGLFNVPFGKIASPRTLSVDEIAAYCAALKSCEVRHEACYPLLTVFRGLFAPARSFKSTAIFCDPPYDGTFNGYTVGGFAEDDQRKLATNLKLIAKHGASVWATNADTPLIREIYSWAQIAPLDEYHSIGSKPSRRGKRGCLLIRGGAAA